MRRGVVGLCIWCVDTTYKIDHLPERGNLVRKANECSNRKRYKNN